MPVCDPLRTLLLDNHSDWFAASIANDALILRQESLAPLRTLAGVAGDLDAPPLRP
jgi:hypothetical protein